jgi:hypothetical protein
MLAAVMTWSADWAEFAGYTVIFVMLLLRESVSVRVCV